MKYDTQSNNTHRFPVIVWIFFLCVHGVSALDYPGIDPGKAELHSDRMVLISLSNQVISACWSVANHRLAPVSVTDRQSKSLLDLQNRDLFTIELSDGEVLRSSEMSFDTDSPLIAIALTADSQSSTLSKQFPGCQYEVALRSPSANPPSSINNEVRVIWRAELRDGSNAIRQSIEICSISSAIRIQKIRWLDLSSSDAKSVGTVPGSPIVSGNFFFAYEHPNAGNQIDANQCHSFLELNTPLSPDQSLSQSWVMGVVPPGQLRRGFLYFIERERAHPYRPFLHYNSWYDICWGNLKITEDQCIKVIETYGAELIRKRHVPLASFVWDDGWDDPQTLWRPLERNFPQGFTAMLEKARSFNSTLGFWLSPFGGYGQPAEDRYKYGREQGFEFNGDKFALAGPRYYERFLETCSAMITINGSNFFKFDGLTRDISETQAMLRLTRALRTLDPNLFISITTGTWPSPFWLWYGDSTWRGDGDMGFAGTGSKREQWITYRDGITYKNVVIQAPLYPLNALMNQGIAQAHYGSASELGNSRNEFRREVQSFFACGTNLQELYISPDMLTQENWDDLAEAALWSQMNQDVLVDTHWIGGDPGKGEVYGWASWSKRKGILSLRNPGDQPASILLDIGKAFELPLEAGKKYILKSPWKYETEKSSIQVEAGIPTLFLLQPFEVCVYDAFANPDDSNRYLTK